MTNDKNRHDGASDFTADSVEGWLRSLGQRGSDHEPADRGHRPGATSRRGPAPADREADAFLRAVRRLATSPTGQATIAARLEAVDGATTDPFLLALARVFSNLGDEFAQIQASLGDRSGGSAGVMERPGFAGIADRELAHGGGGGDDFDDDDDSGDDDDDDDDDEPWPTAFVGYRTGVVDRVDIGNCRDGCCTALFLDHPGVRGAVWFPTDLANELAGRLTEQLDRLRGETADLSVPPFGDGAAPGRGQIQATIQFFTDDIHIDAVEHDDDRAQGALSRFLAYDQGLGHGGPPLVDILLTGAQARAVRKGLRRAARQAPRDGAGTDHSDRRERD